MRIHDIRHPHRFASRALALGEGLPTISRLLSRSRVKTTARYGHLARDSLRVSDDSIALSITSDIPPLQSNSTLARLPVISLLTTPPLLSSAAPS